MSIWPQKILIATAVFLSMAASVHGQTPAASATLAGVIRDSTGAPVPSVEVVLTETARTTRTDSAGRFTLADVTPGTYRVWFRRLGYSSSQFDWAARLGERTEIAVVMTPVPKTLDPVVVYEKENKEMSDRASLLGLVIDSAGAPIDEAEVQLVGANRGGVTRANGGFLFRPLAVGPYVIRIRKLGFEPTVVKLTLVAGDEREVVVRMKRIAANLDPVVVTARSGYDSRDEQVYADLEARMRWKSFKTPVLGPEDLRRYYGADLDRVAKLLLLGRSSEPGEKGYAVHSIMGGRGGVQRATRPTFEEDACILLNGKTPMKRPLHIFDTDQIDLLEVYPPGTEYSGSVGYRMSGIASCASISALNHPTYYVIWLKGSK